MKKLLVLLVLAVAGYLAYHEATMPGPLDAYKKFADAWAWSNNPEALRFASGDAPARALANKPLAGLVPAGTIGVVRATTYTILSTTEARDGEILVQANQAIGFDPLGGIAAANAAMTASFKQAASIRKMPSGWKVVSFDTQFLEIRENPGR